MWYNYIEMEIILLGLIAVLQLVVVLLTNRACHATQINKDIMKTIINELMILYEQRAAKRIQRSKNGLPADVSMDNLVGNPNAICEDWLRHTIGIGG